MQVSVETTSGLERRLTVGVPAERVDSAVNERLKDAAKNVRLDGFRKGKVPMSVVRQRFGASVRMEVLGEVMNESFYEAIQKQDLKPAGRPDIEPKSMEEGKDVEFIATFEIFPEIELRDYSSLSIEKPSAELLDADLDKMIENLRDQRAEWNAVERAAAEGDQVNIDFAGTKDGEAFEGGSAEGTDLVLGSGQMIPGFEDGIAGLSAGDEKTLALSFPEDYHSEALKGAAVEFAVKVNAVKEKTAAELNDEFFALFGVQEGGEEAFRAEVKKNMQRELDSALKNRVKQQVMDGILDMHEDVQIPKALIEQEIDALRNQQMQQFGAMAEQLDVKSILPDELFTEQATRRVKLGLVLNEYLVQKEIKADATKVREAIEEMASTYEDKDQFINWYYSDPQRLQGVESMVVEDQIVDTLLESASVTEVSMSYEEALTPPAPETEEGEEAEAAAE